MAIIRPFGLTVLLCAAPVLAEPPIGSRVGDRLKAQTVQQDRERAAGAHEVAGCLVGKKRKSVERFLSATSPEDSSRLGQLLAGDVDDCETQRAVNDTVEAQRIRYPIDLLRGMLAESLIKTDRASFVQLGRLPIAKIYQRAWYPATFRHLAVNEMATCVAETNPGGVLTLLGTQPYTDMEQAAFGALVSTFGPCLSAGTKLEGKREPLRAALAEALYQRVNFPVTPVVQGAAE